LFKNEAVAAGSPFRAGPLRTLADVETITMNYVDWYNNYRLHSLLDNATPEEYEQAYYAPATGSPTGDAANKDDGMKAGTVQPSTAHNGSERFGPAIEAKCCFLED
jgi:hypothetical protein